jgi:hypothetical protein
MFQQLYFGSGIGNGFSLTRLSSRMADLETAPNDAYRGCRLTGSTSRSAYSLSKRWTSGR